MCSGQRSSSEIAQASVGNTIRTSAVYLTTCPSSALWRDLILVAPAGCNDPPPATFIAANIIVKEVVMFRKTMIALATVAALGALTPTAADARGGGFHGGAFHGGGFGGGFPRGRFYRGFVRSRPRLR